MENKEYISFEDVRNGVNEIIACSNTMEGIFDSVSGNMSTMTTDDVFQGRAKEALEQSFKPFEGQFKNYIAKVREFADSFTQAANELERTEHEIQSKANDLGIGASSTSGSGANR